MRRGQSTVEFVVLVSVVTIAVVAMGTYVFRAVNANMKMIEDQVNADDFKARAIKGGAQAGQ